MITLYIGLGGQNPNGLIGLVLLYIINTIGFLINYLITGDKNFFPKRKI